MDSSDSKDQKSNNNTATDKNIENMSAKKDEKTFPTVLLNLVCLGCFMFFGPSLIMVNKIILRDRGFSYPITHTFYTSIFCAAVVWGIVHALKIPLKNKSKVTISFYMKNIMPIGFLQGATIVLGMSSYLFLSVSFVQMLKASTPVMIVIFLRIFQLETPTTLIIASVLIICFGTLLSGYGELNFNIIGVISMLSAQVAEALRLVFTQKLLKNFKFDVLENLYYVTPAAAFWVFLAALVIEAPMMTIDTVEIVSKNYYLFILAGFLGLGVNAINSIVIKFTGSLMMKLLATARNASLIMFNVIFMGEEVAFIQCCGYIISLAGFILFNYVKKMKEVIIVKRRGMNGASRV
mmetsp:Transcript_16179/g.24402  ORF Transcript_16179/g.24402 Transcript_16179/m.24402 type:complete len:350 (-) Transcript_16179:201-1250(-)